MGFLNMSFWKQLFGRKAGGSSGTNLQTKPRVVPTRDSFVPPPTANAAPAQRQVVAASKGVLLHRIRALCDSTTRKQAISMLRGQSAAEVLAVIKDAMLAAPDYKERWSGTVALGCVGREFGWPDTVALLEACLDDDNAFVVDEAIDNLNWISYNEDLKPAVAACSSRCSSRLATIFAETTDLDVLTNLRTLLTLAGTECVPHLLAIRPALTDEWQIKIATEILARFKASHTLAKTGDQAKAEPSIPKPHHVDEKKYVKNCLQRKYDELPETRSWNSNPAFQKVLDPLNSGDYAAACREAEVLVESFADFADVYRWWGKALLEMRRFDKARSVLMKGLQVTKRKHPLCSLLGEMEAKLGNTYEAVYWWAQGVHCQEYLRDEHFGGCVDTYLYLHYVAEGAGLIGCASAFAARVDQITPVPLRLNSDAAAPILVLGRAAKYTKIKEVLRALVDTYIEPKTALGTKTDSGEMIRNCFSAIEPAEMKF